MPSQARVATWKQSAKIWGFCVRKGNDNADWANLAKEGKLKFTQADTLIKLIIARTNEGDAKAADIIRNKFIPGFALGKPGEAKAPTKAKPDLPKATGMWRTKPPVFKVLTDGYIKPEIFDAVAQMVKDGTQVFLSGPAGCGKSRMYDEIRKVLKMVEFYVMSMAGGCRYAQVFGSTHLIGGKETKWIPSGFLQAVQKAGMVFIDEILSADPEVVIGLNALLEPDCRQVNTPVGIIRVHDDCHLVAAANTVGRQVSNQYTGAQRQDDSLLDRFMTVPMTYDTKVEKGLIDKAEMTDGEKTWLKDSIESLRLKVREHNISFDVSTRRIINCMKMWASGFTIEASYNFAFVSSLSDTEQRKLEGFAIDGKGSKQRSR